MLQRKPKKQYDDDDGEVIVPMNVEGMPDYLDPDLKAPKTGEKLVLSKEESRAYTWGVLKAAFLIGGIYLAVFTVFILFCIFVWFR